MARLKAHGTELLRIEKEEHTPDGALTIWERVTVAFMSDGKVLRKRDVRFTPDRFDPQGRLYSYGWKLYKKVREGASIQGVVTRQRNAIAAAQAANKTTWREVL